MLEQQFLSPYLKGFDLSPAMFIGNAISVSLISWPMMPIAIYFLQWWLNPSKINKTLVNIAGFSLVVFIYLVEIFFFWA